MQATPNSQQFFNASLASYPNLTSVLKWLHVLLTFTGTGFAITVTLMFQQFLIQLYATRWQMVLPFVLMGLMVALLLGQYRLDRKFDTKIAIRWSAMSSLIVTMFGLGVVMCVLTITPPTGY